MTSPALPGRFASRIRSGSSRSCARAAASAGSRSSSHSGAYRGGSSGSGSRDGGWSGSPGRPAGGGRDWDAGYGDRPQGSRADRFVLAYELVEAPAAKDAVSVVVDVESC